MKKLYTLLALVITLITTAQAPQGFNYQATVRNSAGALIVNQNVNFKFNVMLNSATSLPIFSETHLAPTDDLGQVNLVIGQGTATTGTFSTINWGTGNYYLGIELNTGSGYVAMGTTQLLSVPYALYANSSGNSQVATPNLAAVLAVNNGANNLQIKNLADPIDAQDAVTNSYLATQIANLQTQITALQNSIVSSYPIGSIFCTSGSTAIVNVTSPTTGRIWMDRNLGATQVATSSIDTNAYGDLYQWGRGADGHQCRTSSVTSSLSSVDQPAHGSYILTPNSSPYDWRNPQNSNLWQGVSGMNNPCPSGYRLPTEVEWEAERLSWAIGNNSAGAFSSALKLTMGGSRSNANGSIGTVGSSGNYWSSSISGIHSRRLVFNNNTANTIDLVNRALGFSVRCIKN
ncbi:hypothetical protein [Flavobacterium sp.]|jgi:uncharacterized protein (TIGR02145 family)|uniref:hypothetical protein n=1 Tax=Flavobacterium sp. TaxID=239 RepID=UPI0037BEC825